MTFTKAAPGLAFGGISFEWQRPWRFRIDHIAVRRAVDDIRPPPEPRNLIHSVREVPRSVNGHGELGVDVLKAFNRRLHPCW